MNRGEIWWGDLPHIGRRPYLVLTRDAAIPVLDKVICAPLTRTRRGIPSELDLDEDDGLPAECVASFDNIETIPKSLLTERICRLSGERFDAICPALRAATDC